MTGSQKDDDSALVFHYSRERRLREAPESVRQLNADSRRRPSLFKTLVATKASAFLLLAIIMLSATIFVVNFLMPSKDEVLAGGNRFKLAAFSYEDSTYLTVRKTRVAKDAYSGPVTVFARIASDGAAAGEFVPFNGVLTGAAAEDLKFRLQGSGSVIEAKLDIGAQSKPLRATVR